MLEIFGVVASLLYIYLEIKQRSSMWVVGFVSSLAYVIVFYNSGLYALSTLYVYYTAISVYGMYSWRFSQNANNGELPISRLSLHLAAILILISATLWAAIGYALVNWTEQTDTLPYGEALVAALSIVATWMLARKILEHWLVWIFVNFVSAGLYFVYELYPTAALFVVYGILSVVGWKKWKRDKNEE